MLRVKRAIFKRNLTLTPKLTIIVFNKKLLIFKYFCSEAYFCSKIVIIVDNYSLERPRVLIWAQVVEK